VSLRHLQKTWWRPIFAEPNHWKGMELLNFDFQSQTNKRNQNDLTITQGNPRTYTYTGASGKSVHCYFCPRCTSHVYHHQEVMGDQIIVRTILLDGGKDMAAGGEIFGEGRLAWVKEMQEAV